MSALWSDRYRQTLRGLGERELRLTVAELRPDTGEWWVEEPGPTFSTAYRVQRMRARFPDEWILIGEHATGEVVMERWQLFPPAGSYRIDRPRQPEPLGTPVPPLVAPALAVAGGGPWIPPEQRQGTTFERRHLVDASVTGAPVRTLVVDPDGRFVLYTSTSPPGIWQRVLGDPAAEEVLIFDASLVPLADKLTRANVYQHATLGRVVVYAYGPSRPLERLLLVDGENDGIFEELIPVTEAEYEAAFDEASILDDFQHYEL